MSVPHIYPPGMRHCKRVTEVPEEIMYPGEEFRVHPEFTFWRVSSLGRIWSARGRGKFIRPAKTQYGHLMVVPQRRKNRLVHRLVAEAFIGPRPEGADIRHLNGVHTDNRAVNLAYGTRTENIMDAIAHGTWASERRREAWRMNRRENRHLRGTGASTTKERVANVGNQF